MSDLETRRPDDAGQPAPAPAASTPDGAPPAGLPIEGRPIAVSTRGLTKVYDGKLALDRLDLDIARGEIFGYIGPNGAGKTTTIRLVCGLLVPDDGSVEVTGIPVTAGATRAKARIGYVPQDVSLYPDLSARENLTFFGRLYRLSGATLRARRREKFLEMGRSGVI